MGLRMMPLFYLQNGTIDDCNYGSSQATILNTGNLSFETIPILKLQLRQTNATDLVQSSLYYISLGKDECIQLFLHGSFRLRQKCYSPDSACILVQNPHNAKAKKIICKGIRPLGCIATNRTNQSDNRYRNEESNQSILQFNVMLSEQRLDPNANLFDAHTNFCDAYQGLMPILRYPKCYGFTDVRLVCCGMGHYVGMAGCLTKKMVCSDSLVYVWWHFENLILGVKSLLAHWMSSGKPHQLCCPINAADLVQSSLFYISLGIDDYIQLFLHSAFGLREQSYSLNSVCILVNLMIKVVQNTYSAKARKIICMGIGPLGCAPCSLWEAYNATNRTSADIRYHDEEINQKILLYNVMLSEQLLALKTDSFDTERIYCDLYQGLMQILHDPKCYGFTDLRPELCGMGRYGEWMVV